MERSVENAGASIDRHAGPLGIERDQPFHRVPVELLPRLHQRVEDRREQTVELLQPQALDNPVAQEPLG